MDLTVGTRQYRVARVRNVDFDAQGACHRIDCAGIANHRAGKGAAGKLRQRELGLRAIDGDIRITLRYVDIDAQQVGPGDVEQLPAGAAGAAGIDQRTDIDVTGGDD